MATQPDDRFIINASIGLNDPYLDSTIEKLLKQKYPELKLRISESSLGDPGLVNTLRSQIKAGKCDHDIIRLPLQTVQTFAREGLLRPVLDDRYYWEGFYPSIIDPLKYNNKLYGIPEALFAGGLIYRKDLFKKHRLKVPDTMEQLVRAIRLIKSREKKIKHGLLLHSTFLVILLFYYILTDGRAGKPEERILNVTREELTEAFRFIHRCVNTDSIIEIDGLMERSVSDIEPMIAGDEFVAAFYYCQGFLTWLRKRDKKLQKNLGISIFPPKVAGNGFSHISGAAYAVPATTRSVYYNHALGFLCSPEVTTMIRDKGTYPTLSGVVATNKTLERKSDLFERAHEFADRSILIPQISRGYFSLNFRSFLGPALKNEMPIGTAVDNTLKQFKLWNAANVYEELISDVIDDITANYHKQFSMKDIEAKTGKSYRYFAELFKKRTRLTISDYITQLRIDNAKRLLVENATLNVTEIARAVGYDDAFYFSRIFKKTTGTAPSQYRLRHIVK
jgi:AraC-like DNA-binding protein/ABC-type glycerol-3-phosphate transport system substrate-binding protein